MDPLNDKHLVILSIVALVGIVAVVSIFVGAPGGTGPAPVVSEGKTLLGGAIINCDATGALTEGQTTTHTIGDMTYEVTLVYVSNMAPAEAKFSVNGELTTALSAGEEDQLSSVAIRADSVSVGRKGIGAAKYCMQQTSTPPQPSSCDVEDTLMRGETRTYTIAGIDYEVTNLMSGIMSNADGLGAMFSVNGEVVDLEERGAMEGLSGWLQIGLRETNADMSTICLFRPGGVVDTLREGETRTYTSGGLDYEVTNVYVSDPGVYPVEGKFSINGELTVAMREGSAAYTSDGTRIAVLGVFGGNREGAMRFTLG